MATNPMQRKARNSFLLGMFLTLLITGAIIALLAMQIINKAKEEKQKLSLMTNVLVLKQDVTSGQVITKEMLETKAVNKELVPSNATSEGNSVSIDNFAMQDKEGNNVITKTDKNNNAVLYIQKNDKQYELKQKEKTGEYYIEQNGEEQYIELTSVPLVAKVDMKKNTVITRELLNKGDSLVQDDVRKQEYNMVILPMDLVTGDYIDIRLMLPSGQDYIVVSKKEVEIPNANGVDSTDTIWANLSEDEILHMSCAIIDAYQIKGAKLYATKYTEAGMQNAATPTYPINESTARLLQDNPNILDKAKTEIANRYNKANSSQLRNDYINNVIQSQGEESQSNMETNMQESITNSKTNRKEYLDSLAGVVQ